MYSDQLRLIFVHIYKTGGTSVERALSKYTQKQAKHLPAIRIRGILGEKFNKYFKFSIVRNPWDWMVSAYCYKIKRGFTPKTVTFDEFVIDHTVHEPNRLHRWPQIRWITDTEGNILVDKIIRFEKLKRGFNEICSHVQVKVPLPHLNKSDRKHYKKYYNRTTKKIIAKRYAEDIEHFKYRFGSN